MTKVTDEIKIIAQNFCDKMQDAGHITDANSWIVYEAVIHGYLIAIDKINATIREVNKSELIHLVYDDEECSSEN